jgi:hypothetical protein
MFEVPAGGRRYRALELLMKQKRLNKTQAVPCIVSDANSDILDSHHARLSALEAKLAALAPSSEEATKPVPTTKPSRSVEDEAREFYCQRHEGVRLRDVADWMVRDMIDFANQRTAAVERERDNLKWMLDLTNGNLTKADRERDEWKAKFEKLGARWNSDHAAVYAELSAARSERDAALAKVAELEKVLAAVRGVVK